MFSGMKMEEFMESEHSGIFRVELITKNVVLGSSGTHFTHVRVKGKPTGNSPAQIRVNKQYSSRDLITFIISFTSSLEINNVVREAKSEVCKRSETLAKRPDPNIFL